MCNRITFGIDFECLTHPDKPIQFTQEFEFAQSIIDKRFNNPLWKVTELFTKEGAKMRLACKNLSEYAYKIINKRKHNDKEVKVHKDILSLFMNAEINDEETRNIKKLSDKELRDIILNLILAGELTYKKKFTVMQIYNFNC